MHIKNLQYINLYNLYIDLKISLNSKKKNMVFNFDSNFNYFNKIPNKKKKKNN